MQTKAQVKHVKISAKKVRLVADAVRNLPVAEALERLRLLNKEAARPVAKLLSSAMANAQHNFELDKENLYIKDLRVDEGATLKRWMPRAHGRATPIRKRMSHISVTIAEIKDSGDKKGKKQKIEAPVSLSTAAKKEKTGEEKEAVKADRNFDKKEQLKEDNKDKSSEAIKEISDVRREGQGGHSRAEGGRKGFSSKIFRRKSG